MFPLKDNIPNERFPLVTVALIALNVIVYLISIRSGGALFGGPTDTTVVHDGAIPWEFTHPGQYCHYAFVPDAINGGTQELVRCGFKQPASGQLSTWQTAFSAMFLHGGFLHIFGNMLFLAIFGPNVEDAMGSVRFFFFYIVGGLAALALQVAVDPSSVAPTLGASGAIAAVLGGYILLYPRARVLTLIFIIFFVTFVELPAIAVLGFWFLEQVAFAAGGLTSPVGNSGGVAYFAHIGGFVFGLLLVRLLARRPRVRPTPRYPVY